MEVLNLQFRKVVSLDVYELFELLFIGKYYDFRCKAFSVVIKRCKATYFWF